MVKSYPNAYKAVAKTTAGLHHRHTVNPRPMFWNFLDQIVSGRPVAA